jgi:thiol-disulfide isomerase/thioredoxin
MNEFAIDKFLSDEQEDAILNLTTDPNFPWFYSAGTVLPEDAKDNPFIIAKGKNPFQFIHRIDLENCPFVDVLAPILNTLASEFNRNISIVRMKFNMLTRGKSSEFHFPHTDVDEMDDCYTAIYYVNEADGATHLFDQFGPKESDEVTIKATSEPKKGKVVVFRADRFHASSSPVDSDCRIVLNIVFKVSKE